MAPDPTTAGAILSKAAEVFGGREAASAWMCRPAIGLAGDPYAYLKDILEQLTTQPASRIAELLPHRLQPDRAPA
jgi:uncharacterized protein (DUF2384 family)